MSTAEQLDALYELALYNPKNLHQIVDLGVIDETVGSFILKTTGIDVTNFLISIDNYSIIHTLQRHGNPVKEAAKGQLAVQKHHFQEVLSVILEADSVKYDVRRGKEALIFEKKKDPLYFVVKELRQVVKKGKQNRLMLQTFYIKKQSAEP
jgi:phage-Barnase-EndoU-ColicinE5/D-RelE like nuclease3